MISLDICASPMHILDGQIGAAVFRRDAVAVHLELIVVASCTKSKLAEIGGSG